MTHTKTLDKNCIASRVDIGGKALSLLKVTDAGIDVPVSFVLPAGVFNQYVDTDEIAQKIYKVSKNISNYNSEIKKISESIVGKIYNTILEESLEQEIIYQFKTLGSEYVAVRSSATLEDGKVNSWAGICNSYLNVSRQDLIKQIKSCWASMFSEKSIIYCLEKNIDISKLSIAVIIQEMVQAKMSGVAFSKHPVNGNMDTYYVEVVAGCGDELVSGKVTPDRFFIDKSLKRNINLDNEKFNAKEVSSLVNILNDVGELYDTHLDIEWAQSRSGKFCILQVRPITSTGKLSRNNRQFESIQNIGSINHSNYEMLWNFGQSFFDYSIALACGYDERDFIAIVTDDEIEVYVHDDEIKRLGKNGLKIYTSGFDAYEKEARQIMPALVENTKQLFEDNVKSKNNYDLGLHLVKVVNLRKSIFKLYFHTEYHSSRLVEDLLSGKTNMNDVDLDLLSKNADRMAKLKYELKECIAKFFHEMNTVNKILNEISNRYNLQLPPENYHHKELIDLLTKSIQPVSNRSGKFVIGKPTDWKEVFGVDAEIIHRQLSSFQRETNEFYGDIACPGIYRGTVKNIRYSLNTDYAKEIDSMKKGQILVTGSTSPEMILACRKAGAMITDEGGIISHAALLAREFNIPTVINTKRATKLLSDGDLVEVDARSGKVKILSKK